MIVHKNAAKKSLAVTLALALGVVLPSGALAQIEVRAVPGAASAASPAAAAVAGLSSVSVTIPSVALSLPKLAPSLEPVVGRSAPAASFASPIQAAPAVAEAATPIPSAAAGAVEAHPVIALINQLQSAGVSLPDGFGTRQDADKLDAAAHALPAGSPIRSQLAQIAATIRSSGGGAFDGRANFIHESDGFGPHPGATTAGVHELTAAQVRYSPKAEVLPDGTKSIDSSEQKIVGQDDAVEAIRFSLEMPGDQYNIFVAGPEGSGRELAIRRILNELAPKQSTPNDLIAVTNFDDKEKPLILETAPGKGKVFEEGVAEFVENMTKGLVAEFSTGQTAQAHKQIQASIQKLAETGNEDFQKKVSEMKIGQKFGVFFQPVPGQDGNLRLMMGVTYEGKPMKQEEIDAHIAAGAFTLAEYNAAQAEIKSKSGGIIEAFRKMSAEIGAKATEMTALAEQLNEQAATGLANTYANELLAKVAGQPETPATAALQERAAQREQEIQQAYQQLLQQKFGVFNAAAMQNGAVVLVYEGTPLVNQKKLQELIAAGKFTLEQFTQAQAMMSRKFGAVNQKAQQYQEKTQQEASELAATLPPPSAEQAALTAYVQKLAQFAVDNYGIFLAEQASEGKPGMKVDPDDFFRVSVLSDNSATRGAPVVFEENPTFERLFGSAKDNVKNMMIPGVGLMKSDGPGGPTLKGGSYHKANGGYLVLNALSVLKNPGAWGALMQAVATGKADIEEGGLIGLLSRQGDAYPVPTKVKVVLIGSPMIRMLLEQHDGDFAKSFLGVSQFQSTIKITEDAVAGFLNFLRHAVDGSGGRVIPLTKDAIARVLEQAARMASSNQNFTAQFGAVHGLLQEATYWAKRSGQTEVRAVDVDKALSAKIDREEGYIKRMREAYEKGIFTVETSGEKVGQLNGLAVMGSTGVVMRITFLAVPGQPGIVSLDKDSGPTVTGPSFNKALGVEWSFIVNEFGREKPVRAQIRLSHEQNYGGIDGDSATSTTIYGILSALSGVPIQQKFAMTGSADQFGNVQAIGGVNEKIEGFFALCKSRGLTGDQGVIIPKTNVADLQLSPEVTEAIKEGRFHIYAVDHVSQGIEILTGRPYSEIKEKAQKRLVELSGNKKGGFFSRFLPKSGSSASSDDSHKS